MPHFFALDEPLPDFFIHCSTCVQRSGLWSLLATCFHNFEPFTCRQENLCYSNCICVWRIWLIETLRKHCLYDRTIYLKRHSVPCIIWNSELLWVVPSTYLKLLCQNLSKVKYNDDSPKLPNRESPVDTFFTNTCLGPTCVHFSELFHHCREVFSSEPIYYLHELFRVSLGWYLMAAVLVQIAVHSLQCNSLCETLIVICCVS